MTRLAMFALFTALTGTMLLSTHGVAEAARYKVACIAPNGPWCRIFCQSNRGVACYANVVNGRCLKTCRYN